MRYFFLFFFLFSGLKKLNAQSIPEIGLIAYYSFNKVQGRDTTLLIDNSSKRNHGNIIGVVSYEKDRFNNNCSALIFDGKTYIKVPNSPSLKSPKDALTIAVWFKLTKGSDFFRQWITICCKSDQVIESPESPQYRMQSTAQTISINSAFTKNVIPQLSYEQWYFYAYTFDGNTMKAYLDGKYFYEMDFSGPLVENNMPLEIGRDLPGGLEYYFGTMDDLRIYNRALSESELFDLFTDQTEEMYVDRCNFDKVSAPAKSISSPSQSPIINAPSTSQVIADTLVEIGSYIGLPASIENLPVDYQKTIEVKNRNIVIYPFDNKLNDGDIVSINLNGNWVKENYTLLLKQANPTDDHLIRFQLNPGENNFLISKALNEGKMSPNTMTLLIDDGISKQQIKVDSKIGLSGGIRIICK